MLLKVPQAAAELNVAVSTAWELVKSGELESIVIGEKMRRVPREALVEYIEAKRQQARAS
jgi:excisionase family DNA binding protein